MTIPSEACTLYLEDEALIALDGVEALHDLGMTDVHSVRSLKKAEALAAKQSFDIAILDVNVGNGNNSFSLARELISCGTRVLFVSGYNPNEFPDDLRSVHVLSKPFTTTSLGTAILKALAQAED